MKLGEWTASQYTSRQIAGSNLPGSPQLPVANEGPSSRKKEEHAGPASLRIESEPPGAEVYLDWHRQGVTPVTIEAKNRDALLILIKDGYFPAAEKIGSYRGRMTLSTDTQIQQPGVLLFQSEEDKDPKIFSFLRDELMKLGPSVTGVEEMGEFRNRLVAAGSISNPALRGWAKANFHVNILIKFWPEIRTVDLGQEVNPYSRTKKALEGVYKSEVILHLEIINLTSGRMVASFSTMATSVLVGQGKSYEEAASESSAKAAKKALPWILAG